MGATVGIKVKFRGRTCGYVHQAKGLRSLENKPLTI
uniref:Uncharacterized protein n=1 Tax=Siphoviridae sp. ct8Hx23 TaxID=2825360 RepID=A0A8S5P7D8_9CAUD|nr:MAG TPA: hypothetical protein [Siphoviridae sp. ct8Hx23]